jgi:Prokaryotic phospholipase A2
MRWKRLAVGAAAAAMVAGLFVVAPSIVTPEKAPQAQAHAQYTNGCSVPTNPWWRDTPGGFNFHDACDRHDLNYVNRPHGVNEWGRSVADLIFWYDMLDVCRRYVGQQRTNCRSWAQAYYAGVRSGGWFFYYHWDKWVRANVRVYIV